jgi:protein TonB
LPLLRVPPHEVRSRLPGQIDQVRIVPSPPQMPSSSPPQTEAMASAQVPPSRPPAKAVATKPREPIVADRPGARSDSAPQATGAPAVPGQTALRYHNLTNSTAATFSEVLLEHIRIYQRYPDAAAQQSQRGVVQVLFAMNRNGTAIDVRVTTSSGFAMLDQEAVAMVRRAQPLPRIPAQLPDRLNVLLPVAFSTR